MVMSKKTDKETKKSQVEEVNPEVVEDEADSPWYYFYSQGCGWCKRSEPIVDELIKEGHDILKLDLADKDNQALNNELKQEYKVQCGTPWFINEATGKGICGFREKDILEKWLKDNEHMPKEQLKTAEQLLAMPRPNTQPPKPPQPNYNDQQFDDWGKEYDAWVEENKHLPNLQPSAQIIERMKANRPTPGGAVPSPVDNGQLNTLDAKVQALEVKVDKIISHFGIK